MKRLTEIDRKKTAREEFTKKDLRFLYQLDGKINGFGYQADPRIKELITPRDIKEDLTLVTGYPKDQISTTKDEGLRGGIKLHYGDLKFYASASLET